MQQAGYLLGKIAQRAKYNVGKVQKEAGLALDRRGCQFTNDISYLTQTSRHRQTMPIYDAVPVVQDAWVAPNASLIGDVMVSKWATVWYNVTIRGEINPVRIGNFTTIGDGTSINAGHALPHGITSSVNIGKNVTIEAGCSIHSCIIDDDVVIGAGSVIGQGARIERGAVILPNSIVPHGRLIPGGQVWGGNPVTFVRELSEQELTDNYTASYTKGAAEGAADSFSLYPRGFDASDLPAGEESINEYAHKKYFNQ